MTAFPSLALSYNSETSETHVRYGTGSIVYIYENLSPFHFRKVCNLAKKGRRKAARDYLNSFTFRKEIR